MIWVDKRCSGRVLNEAIICSLWPTQWSSGILRIDLRSGYLSEVSNLVSLWLFYILGYIFQSDQRLVFGILNYRSSLLCLVLSGYSLSSVFRSILGVILSIHYIGNSITVSSSSTTSGLSDKEIISGQHYMASFEDLYSRKCRRCLYSDYCSINLGVLPVVIIS